MVILKPIASNWSRSEREKLNNNWTIIENYLSNLQGQINLLTGDVNVQELIDQLNQLLSQSSLVLEELESALANIETIITNAQSATDDANNASQSALNAVNDIQNMIDNFQTKGTFDMETIYSKNNSVLYEGSSYIYINDTPTKGNPPPNYPQIANDYWHMTAAKGASGEGAVSKVNGKEPNAEGEIILAPSDIGAASSTKFDEHLGQIASPTKLGHIKPDGTTIIVDPETGVARAIGGSEVEIFTGDLNTLVEKGTYLVTKDSTNKPWIYDIVVEVLPNYDGSIVWQQARINQAGANNAIIIKRVGFKNGDSYTWLSLPNGSAGSLDGWAIINPSLDDSLISSSLTSAATANAVKKLNDLKADKVQENFIQAVLSMGTQDSAYPISYYKDSLGRVHVEGQAQANTSGMIAFTMPVGYRPVIANQVLISKITSPTGYHYLILQTNGYFLMSSGTASAAYAFSFSYKAGA